MAAITGAYTLGVMISRHEDLKHLIADKASSLSYGFLVPVFFVSIGLEANAPLESLNQSLRDLEADSGSKVLDLQMDWAGR